MDGVAGGVAFTRRDLFGCRTRGGLRGFVRKFRFDLSHSGFLEKRRSDISKPEIVTEGV